MQPTSSFADAMKKIRSDNLRQEAIETRSEPHVVIVEINIPHPKIVPLPSDADRGGVGTRFKIESAPSATNDADRRVAETRKAIQKITGNAPERFFSSSGAFVVTATGNQLRQLACLPSVSAIWPNEPPRSM
jgi:hypothetical protein